MKARLNTVFFKSRKPNMLQKSIFVPFSAGPVLKLNPVQSSKRVQNQNFMKKLFILGLIGLAGLTSARNYGHQGLSLNVAENFVVYFDSTYRLSCDGAEGKVNYEVDGLPEGVKLVGDRIFVSGDAKPGRSILRIRARDAMNEVDEEIVTLIIKQGNAVTINEPGSDTTEQTSTSTTISTDGRFDQLINAYSSISTTEKITYESNRYPEVEFPEGGNLNTINTLSTKILNMQAKASQENRNIITEEDIALKTAAERHQAAVKGITNLLTIIDQARANRNYAQSQLQSYVQAYNDALVVQREAQNKVIIAETRKTQIISAIEGINEKILKLNNDLADLDSQRQELKAAKATILEKITSEEKIKAGLLGQLEKINAELAALMKELSLAREKCQSIQSKIDISEDQLIKAKADLASIVERRITAEKDVAKKEDIVDDLRKKLAIAEQNLADAEIKLSDIIADEKRLPVIIREIERRLVDLQNDLAQCQKEIDRIQSLIDGIESDDLTDQVREIEESILEGRQKIIQIDQQISALTEPYEKLKNDLDRAQQDLVYLRTQISVSEQNLRQAYMNGNDANTAVQHAKENLEAINKRYQAEETIICEATLNLERARAQQNLARLGLEEIIAHYSNALPYAIVPNGNLQTQPGTPFGNNPSGSPLGPIKVDGDGAEGYFTIKSWTHYLSQAFGSGVHPAFKGSVTKLFPFHFLSTVKGHRVENNYGNLRTNEVSGSQICGGLGPMQSLSGEILWIGDESFQVRMSDGQDYYVGVNQCTQLTANVPNYSMSVGDEVVFRGVLHSQHNISANQITCLRNYY